MYMFRVITSVCLILATIVGCGSETGNGPDDYESITVNNITLQWKTDTLGNLLVKVSASTVGWVAVGFDPTIGMQDANIIIGYIVNDTVHIRDDFGSELHAHAADTAFGGVDNVVSKTGVENAGTTEISFMIPLDSGDLRDRVLVKGQSYNVILAWGTDDAFDMPHTVRVVTQIEI